MHGVAADDEAIRPTQFQAPRGIDHECRCRRPVAARLERLDFGEIERPEQELRRMKAAEAPAHRLVQQAVIDRRALPAEPADEADGLHRGSRPSSDKIEAPYPASGRSLAGSRSNGKRPP